MSASQYMIVVTLNEHHPLSGRIWPYSRETKSSK